MSKRKQKQPLVNMEALHRDYKFLSEFIHTQEGTDAAGLLTYECTLLDRLEATIWDQLDKEDQTAFDTLQKQLSGLIGTALNNLERTAKQEICIR